MQGYSRQGAVSFQALGSRLQKLPAKLLQVENLIYFNRVNVWLGFTDYATFVFSFLPHYALLVLHSVGVGSPIQITQFWWECLVMCEYCFSISL